MPATVKMLALAALLEVADASGDAPIPPSLQLRALLALLWRMGDRQREPFSDFWDVVTSTKEGPREGDA